MLFFRKLSGITKIGRSFLFDIHVLAVGIIAGVLSWKLGTLLKTALVHNYHIALNPWTEIFFQPQLASLINYVCLCMGMAIYGVLSYRGLQLKKNDIMKQDSKNVRHVAATLAAALVLVLFVRYTMVYSDFVKIVWISVAAVPVVYLFFVYGKQLQKNAILLPALVALLVLLCVEPFTVVKGPVYLMNEYKDLYGKTLVNKAYVDNAEYLKEVTRDAVSPLSGTFGEDYSAFYQANELEYTHQNISRGQINHIEHILNPINEYLAGKPLRDVYMQYGLGNTLLLRWTMGMFGGISIENYYKCYTYYAIYFVIFLSMLAYLFKDSLYVFNVFILVAISFFAYGYVAFILAPGIIPTIHLFDAFVSLLLLLFLRRSNSVYMILAILLCGLSIILNRQFGLILTASVLTAHLFYLVENKDSRRRYGLSVILLMLMLVISSVSIYLTSGTRDDVFAYFFLGYFATEPPSTIIYLTLGYLLLSYYFLLVLAGKRFPLKYFYIFLFMYAQGLLVYFYWSGYLNHLPMVIPFIGIQLFLMIYMIQRELVADKVLFSKAVRFGLIVIALFSVMLLDKNMKNYYAEKRTFQRNFLTHRTYAWEFDRAHLISTIDPKPLQDSVSLIQKYSQGDNAAICIISQYDNILPFLAHRYSSLPFFDMSWFLLSAREHALAVDKINEQKPEYIFVDSGIDKAAIDPWDILFNTIGQKLERESHFGRYAELKKIFDDIKGDYQKIEEGQLLSVYKRKSVGSDFKKSAQRYPAGLLAWKRMQNSSL